MINYLEFILFSLLGFIIRLLPLRAAQIFGRFLGLLSYWLFPRRRSIALGNLNQAFPELRSNDIKRIATRSFESFGISMAEFAWFPKLTPQRLRKFVRMPSIDFLAEVYSRGKGVILMSGHFGNWELLALATGHFSGYPITIIVQKQRNQFVDEVINRHRCLWGNSVVPMEHSVRETLRKLSKREAVAMLADQSAPAESLFVPFFGRLAATHEGPAIFSLRTGAPILMMFLVRKDGAKYEALVEEVKTDDLTGYSDENVVELTRRHVAILEQYIRRYPEQWLWMHRRWKHKPRVPIEKHASTTTTRAAKVAETAERR